ncbi:VPLPA-CTERM sorting domain-containing protein [Roseibium sp.]|uniref:VPLPA-CTERM sorting domain-containing protein n=1 Tax=Roseibium sp. TaxID=1936156 RepID=UPI003BA98868
MFLRSMIVGAAIALTPVSASALSLIDGATNGLYNDGIGGLLNGTNPILDDNNINTFLFPNNNSTPNDPLISNAPEPDLSAASAALGNWLSTPATPGGSWSGPQAIPSSWAVNTETAIIYEIDGGNGGLTNVVASFGVDNGIFVWLNGIYVGGALSPGGASPNEYVFNLGSLAAGSNYLQVLREDHGGGTGYNVSVTGDVSVVPLPASGLLLLGGLAGLAAFRRRQAERI